ncbi:uncharacterized protein PFL1_04796 [Pseudozyma flocculosa PF-1]|uniref:Uncharacterized protein n=1 Tax=Pseudozyma flocculosa PF-1 TaxID=1277687 RepID=A0A061H4V5_9BASI|nr:uncharacterized protein PFL1_04796 [Pseudozyma flocculosa PF-1]EPQ27658.1 hypothetical protein PFL1_04796 [Pseudozyma flocculosa PF-1]
MFRMSSQPSKKRRYTSRPAERNGGPSVNGGGNSNGDGASKADFSDDGFDYNDPRETYGNQSLPVAELPVDFDGIPLDGEQYLATVRMEAASHPSIFYAPNNPYAAQDDDVVVAPALAEDATARDRTANLLRSLSMPSEDWRLAFLDKFRNMRESLSNAPMEKVAYVQDRLPRPGNADGWYAWIHGTPPAADGEAAKEGAKASSSAAIKPPSDREDDDMDLGDSDAAEEADTPGSSIKEPSGGALRRLNTDHVLGILDAFPSWLSPGLHLTTPYDEARGQQPAVDGVVRQDTPVIHPLHARWLFALLAWLDSRLVSEQISVLRTLARACITAISISRIRNKALKSRKKRLAASSNGGSAATPTTAAPAEASAGDSSSGSPRTASPEAADRVHPGEIGAWMVVTAIAGIWGQTDLWDDAIADLKKTAG